MTAAKRLLMSRALGIFIRYDIPFLEKIHLKFNYVYRTPLIFDIKALAHFFVRTVNANDALRNFRLAVRLALADAIAPEGDKSGLAQAMETRGRYVSTKPTSKNSALPSTVRGEGSMSAYTSPWTARADEPWNAQSPPILLSSASPSAVFMASASRKSCCWWALR